MNCVFLFLTLIATTFGSYLKSTVGQSRRVHLLKTSPDSYNLVTPFDCNGTLCIVSQVNITVNDPIAGIEMEHAMTSFDVFDLESATKDLEHEETLAIRLMHERLIGGKSDFLSNYVM
jgi:hypothetical protein